MPPVKPAPGITDHAGQAIPLTHVLTRNAPRPLVKRPRRHRAQHFPFTERAPKPGPRLWTAEPGEGIRARETGGISQSPAANGEGCCTKCNVHNLWKNLLIICWGREVNGQ